MSQQLPATLRTPIPPRSLAMTVEPGAIISAHRGLVLRHARDTDAQAILALITTVWSEYPGKTLVAENDMPELLAPASAYRAWGGAFWVVAAGERPHGRIIGTVALRDSAEPLVVELQKLYVARGVRNNGLGGFLCDIVERAARARGARTIELRTDIKLRDAHRCYEKRGYLRGSELKIYDDTSATIRFYYRKDLGAAACGTAPGHDPGRDPGPWSVRLHPRKALPGGALSGEALPGGEA